ncbi:MAG: YdeI/OmpD-associated family protein [Gemmatimonadetes bacterium]|nr:YdeI/OmpD-associated family protein [Gemmatimonadota bacterium]
MKTGPIAGQHLSFHAVLENWAEGMNYCAVAVPAAITAALGTAGPVLVLAQVNESEPFQVSLFPVGGGQHYLRIKAKVRQETKSTTGDRIRVRVTVLDRAHVELPDDLRRALVADEVLEAFLSLPPGKQQYIIRRIDDAVKAPTRVRRIQEAVTIAQQRREQRIDAEAAG